MKTNNSCCQRGPSAQDCQTFWRRELYKPMTTPCIVGSFYIRPKKGLWRPFCDKLVKKMKTAGQHALWCELRKAAVKRRVCRDLRRS